MTYIHFLHSYLKLAVSISASEVQLDRKKGLIFPRANRSHFLLAWWHISAPFTAVYCGASRNDRGLGFLNPWQSEILGDLFGQKRPLI